MANPFRLRAEDEDIRDQAAASLERGQQQVEAQQQPTEVEQDTPAVRAAQYKLNEDKRQEYERNVREAAARRQGQPTTQQIDAAQARLAERGKLTREDNTRLRDMRRQAAADERVLDNDQFRQRQNDIDRMREEDAMRRDAERQQAEQDAIATRQHAASGGETITDPVTGRSTIATHPDGAPKFKSGAITDPRIERTPQADIASVPGMGAAMTLGGPIKTHQAVQEYRDDRGNIATLPMEEKVDPATGETYVETKDQFGRDQRLVTGSDQKVKRTLEIDNELAQLSVVGQNLAIQAQQIEPGYKAAKEAFDAAKSKYDVAPKYVQISQGPGKPAKWVEASPDIPTDPAEQRKWAAKQFEVDPQKLDAFRRERAMDQQAYEISKRNLGAHAPAWDNLQTQIAEAKTRQDKARLRKKRVELGLPEDDGGIAEIGIAMEDGTLNTDQAAVQEYLSQLPADTRARVKAGLDPKVAQPEQPAAEIPLIPVSNDTSAVQAFTSAFRGIQNPQEFTVSASGKTFHTLRRNGQDVGTIYKDQGSDLRYIALSNNEDASNDLRATINLDADGGMPVYLKDNPMNPPSPAREAAWATGVFAALQDQALDDQAKGAYLEKENATAPALMKRIKAGEISVQIGGAMLRDLYGIELSTGDYNDPALFQKWLQETSARELKDGTALIPQATTAAKWAKASKDRISLSQQENIKNDYAADYVLANPLLNRAQQKSLYAQNARHNVGTWDRIRSMGNASIDLGADVAGSSIGMPLGLAEDALYGVAAIGSENARKQIAEKMHLRNMSTEAWRQGVVRFTKALATAEGREISAQRDVAMREWMAVVDRNADAATPDQAAEDAAAQKAIAATLALHNLARNPDDPIEARHLDPQQDKALRMAMQRYKATADPRAWALLDERMLMSNDRRWVSAEMEELAGPKGGFFGAINRGMSAGWEEVGSEALSWLTLGTFGALTKGGKAINAAAKANKAYQATRIGRVGGSIYHGLKKAATEFDNLGKAAGTLQKPLTSAQRMGNAALRGGKVALIGGVTEGYEELVPELGADNPNFAQAFGVGFVGGIMLLPFGAMQSGIGGAIATHQQQAKLQDSYHRYAREYNRVNADLPGFQPIDAKTAEFASLFVSPQMREAGLQQLGAEMEALQAAIAQEDAGIAAGEMPSENYMPMHERLASLESVSTMLAEEDVAAMDVVAGFEQLKPEEKTSLIAYAKAAAGRADLLTPQERRAIQAKNTEAGAAVFQGDAITPEGMAMLVEQYPVLGKLPQFQQAAQPAAQAQPTPADNVAGTANVQRLPGTPEQQQQAGTIAQQVMAEIATEMPAIAQRVAIGAPALRVSGGVSASIDAAGQSRIQIIPEDIAHALATGMTPEQVKARVKDNIVLHETIHALQFQVVAQQAAAAGDASTPDVAAQNFYQGMHAQMAAEAPQMLEQGRALYGEQDDGTAPNWDTLPEWAQAAEVVRMLTEAKLAGRTTDVSRLLDGASPSLLQKLAQIVKDMITAITTGQMPESVKQHVDTLTDLYNELANATPSPSPSSPNPGNNPSQPAPGQTGAGNSPAPQGNGNPATPNDGASQPAPGVDTGASAQSAEQVAQDAAKAEYDLALKARPLLKKDVELMSALRIAAMEARVAATADPQNATRIAKDIIGRFLLRPDIAERLAELNAEQSAKAREYRAAAQARVDAEADRVIAGNQVLAALDFHGVRIVGPPRDIGLIRDRVKAAEAAGQPVNPDDQAVLDVFDSENYNGMPTVSDYPGGGKNAVARAIIQKIYTRDGSGVAPDNAVSYGNISDLGITKGSDLHEAIANSLREYVNGPGTSNLPDPNADTSGMTDEQIEAMLQREAKAQTLSKWKGIVGREGLMGSTAQAYEEEFESLAAAEGYERNEDGQLADPFGDSMPQGLHTQLEQRAAYNVDERSRPKTPAQTATLNPRVEELSKPMEGGLVAADAVLETAPLTAAQNHLPGLTRVRQTPLVQRALALAERIIPYFQGNKLKMTGPVVSSQEQYSTAEQRAAVHTMYDLFGGGGAWGIVLAESLYPNLRTLHINEFDSSRAIKIKAQVEYGDQFAAIVNSPEVRNALAAMIAAHRQRPAVQAKIAKQMAAQQQGDFIAPQNLTPEEIAEMNEAWSWGVINKTAAQYAKSLDAATQDRVIAVLKTMADDPERSGPWFKSNPDAEPTVDELVAWFTERHAPKAASIKQTADRMKARGVDFQFHQGDAYAMEIENGPGTVVVADPPYFATTGYDEVNQKQVVNTDIYRRSADLMASLVENDNHVIYTDEAWWLRKNIDNAIRPADLVEGQKIAGEIGNTLDFTVVAEQIDSRYETLGLHNPAGSPVAASRSASRSRDLYGDNQGSGDGGGNQRGGGTAAVEVPPRTNDQAGLQPSGNPAAPAGEDLTNLPKGAVVWSEKYKSEGNVIIEGPMRPRPIDGVVSYPARTQGGRSFNILPEEVTRVVSKPGVTLQSPAAQPRIRRSIGELEELAKSQETFRFWFQDFRGFLEDFLGPNKDYAPLVSEFLNATSAASTVGSNVVAMMKALREYIETGTFVSDFLPAHLGNLHRAQSGQTLSGPKISEYSDAIFGIETAVPVDRHIAQLLFNTEKPTAAQIRAAKIRVAKVGLRLGWTPRQTMATLWAANIARSGRTPQSYERYLQKHRYEIRRLLSADRQGNQRGLKASRRIAARIEQRRGDERATGGLPAGSEGLNGRPAIQTTDGRTLEAPGLVTLQSPAYHGTPHTFKPETRYRLPDGTEQWFVDGEQTPPAGSVVVKRAPKGRFRADKVGTGEGAQAYGWGVAYSAQDQRVGEEYRKNLADFQVTLDGTPLSPESLTVALGESYPGYLDGVINATGLIRRWMESSDKSNPYQPGTQRHALWAELESRATSKKGGSLYKVDLKPAEDEYLDWDKPLSEQSEKIRDLIKPLIDNHAKGFGESTIDAVPSEYTLGMWLYSSLANRIGSEQAASAAMKNLGIRGIRYLDGNSRLFVFDVSVGSEPAKYAIGTNQWATGIKTYPTRQEAEAALAATPQSYNYVIFDEADIEITEENGQPVDAAALFSPAAMPSKSADALRSLIANPPNSLSSATTREGVIEDVIRKASGGKSNPYAPYVLRLLPLDSVTPVQEGEDYLNDSSRETARRIADGSALGSRWQDAMPIHVNEDGTINDGHHRHAAATINGDSAIPAVMPQTSPLASQGTALFSPAAAPAKEWTQEEIREMELYFEGVKLRGKPITAKNAFSDWFKGTDEDGIITGYRGVPEPDPTLDPPGWNPEETGSGSSEGIGLYLAKTEQDASFFGDTRRVSFPKPKRPIIVDEDGGMETIPLLNEEAEAQWKRIFSHKTREGDSDWMKAHILAAKQIGLTEDTWADKIDDYPRALTDKLLAMGYDAVYVRSGGMEWVNILAKPGQRFNRGTRTERGTALYSPAARMASPAQMSFEFKDKPSEYLLDMRQVDSQPLPEAARKKAYATMRDTLDQWNDIDSPTPNLSYIDDVRKYLGTAQEAAAAVRSYVTAGFTEMATMPDHPASKALQRALSLFPDRKPERMIRGLGFPTQAAAMAYVRDFKPGAVAVQARQFASWSEANGQWEDLEGYDLPSSMSMQHGKYTVTLRVTPGVHAKDISLATTGQDFDKGVELVTQKGTQMRVKSVERDGQNWIVYMDGLSRPSKQAQALFSPPASNPSAEYRYLKAKQEKAGLTPAEEQALLRAEKAMGQTFAIDMDDPALRARKGSVSPAFQPSLNLETRHPITGQQLALFSPAAISDEAARAAGYVEGWHGSPDFQGEWFNRKYLGRNIGLSRGGFSFAPDRQSAEAYLTGYEPEQAIVDAANDVVADLAKADPQAVWTGPYGESWTSLKFQSSLVDDISDLQSYLRQIAKSLRQQYPDLADRMERAANTDTERQPNPRLIRAWLRNPEKVDVHGRTAYIVKDPADIIPAQESAATLGSAAQPNTESEWFKKNRDNYIHINLRGDALFSAPVSPSETPQTGWTKGVHFTANEFTEFSHEKAVEARRRSVSTYESTPKGGIRPGYTTPYGRGFVFPGRAHFFFIGDAPKSSPVGKPLSVHLKLDNALDLTKHIPGDVAGRIIDFVKAEVNSEPTPGHWGYTARGDKLGGFRNARKHGITAQQLWNFLNDNTFTRRAEMWDKMLAAIGKDAVIFHGNSSGTFIGEVYRGPADGNTYTVAAVVDEGKIRITPSTAASLGSAAAQPDDKAALEAALRGLDPIYGDVLKASQESPSPSPEELAQRFNLPERAIHNIIGTVRTRIQAQGRTIRPGGLQPQRTDDGRLKGGMPKRANSTIPHLAAVDQLQQQEGLPLSKTNREIHEVARRIAARPDALDHLLTAQRSGAPTAEQIAATAHYLRESSIRGDQSPKLTELAILYREQGTRQSEEFRARIDQYHTPSERNALIFQNLLTAPNKKVRKAYEEAKTPEAKLAILEAWNAKVKGIKEAMKKNGIDLDAALARLAEQRANVQAGENYASEAHQKLVAGLNAEVAQLRQQLAAAQDEAARAAAQAKLTTAEQNAAKAAELDPSNTIRLELEKLRREERDVIEHLRETQDWAAAAQKGFMEIRDVKRLVERFQDAVATAGMQAILLAQDILLDREPTLQAPAANAPDSVKEAYRLAMAMTKIATGIDPDAINRKAAGKPPKGTRQKKTSGPEPAMMSDEQFAAYQANPQTWRPLWQAEAALTGQRMTFEEWQAKPETEAIKQRQERMFKQPVSTTTGDLDMHDPLSVKRAYDAFNIHSASLFDKAMEFWRTSILSGPQTAIVNFGGNVAHSLYHLGPRRILEAGVNDVLGIIGLGSKDAATLGELRVMSKQVHKALGKAGSDMLRSWAMDDRVVEAEVLALGKQMEFSGLGADHSPQAMGGKVGAIMRGISFRHMTASDEFLKSFHSHVEVAAQAYRMAKAEGLKGDAMEARIEELMKYGSPAWQKAYNSAEWVTFQTRPDKSDRRAISFLDRFAKGIRRFAQTDTGRTMEITKIDKDGKIRKEVVPVMKPNAFSFFFPFINTPLNIFKIGIEMSPIGAFFSLVDATRALKERMDKGHLTPEAAKAAASELYDKQRLVKDITNQIIGAGLFWALGTLVKPDEDDELPFITGSVDWKRTSRGDRDVRAKVMPAYSIRIGDAIFSYQRIEPFGTALGFLVDMRLAVEKHGGLNDAALGEFMTTAINQLDNKTYLQGVSDLFNLVHDPSRVGTKITGNLVTGFVPNLIRQPIREADPYVRDTAPASEDGFMEAVSKRIGYSLAPGYAPPMLDVWGNPIERNPGAKLLGSPITDVVWRVFDPTHLAVGKDIDPIDRYIFNWNNSQAEQKARFNIEPIQDTLTITRNGITHKVAISQEDHLAANRAAGQAARRMLGDKWDPVNPSEQGIERIKEVVRHYQKRQRDMLRQKYQSTIPQE